MQMTDHRQRPFHRTLLILVLVGAALLGVFTRAEGAGQRVALAMGNNAYSGRPLRNCVNDAKAIGAVLGRIGFTVKIVTDADWDEMDEGLTWLEKKAQGADLGLLYYSGHGMQVDEINYLIPVGTNLRSESQVRRRSINATLAARTLHESGCQTSVLILDACRDNPFVTRMKSATSRGLAPMKAFRGSYIAFAADAGQTADDNPRGQNGLYTDELLKHIATPGLTIQQVFIRTRNGVLQRSGNRQVPAEYSKLTREDVNLLPEGTRPPRVAVQSPRQGVLSVSSVPSGASIFLAGSYTGSRTPADLIRDPGPYTIALRLAGYEEWTKTVQLSLGGYEGIKARLDKEAAAWTEPESPPSRRPSRPANSGSSSGSEDGEMVKIPAGWFLMGSNYGYDAEKPRRRVYVDEFWIDKYEVTNRQFERFVNATGHRTDAEKRGSSYTFDRSKKERTSINGANWRHPQGPGSRANPSHPVVHVSWNDATAYVNWAGKRLPTEAEWEKAARGTDGRKYAWGSQDPTGRLVNFADRQAKRMGVNWGEESVDDGYAQTAPVGSFPSGKSPYGAHDMGGNVWEWCFDEYDKEFYKRAPDRNPRHGSSHGTGGARVVRGGAWFSVSNLLRCSGRDWNDPPLSNGYLGFRCARSSR